MKPVTIIRENGPHSWIYFLGIIGSAVYFIEQTSGFWPAVVDILKAFVWPAFLVYQAFVFLQ